MAQAVFNAIAIGTTAPVIWITLWVIAVYGPHALETFNHLTFNRSCARIPPQRMMILGVTTLFCVLSLESFMWLVGFALDAFGGIDKSARANLAETITFIVRQLAIIVAGVLVTISGIRARNPKAYVGQVGWSVLILLLVFTAADALYQLARAN